MLVEQSTDAGDVVQIVFRNGGLVDANALESLCDKVQQGWFRFSMLHTSSNCGECDCLPCNTVPSVQVGWPRRPLTKVQTALANSFLTSGLYLRHAAHDSQKSDQLIGLARATSDHVFNATIWDVLVDPAYQVSRYTHMLYSITP